MEFNHRVAEVVMFGLTFRCAYDLLTLALTTGLSLKSAPSDRFLLQGREYGPAENLILAQGYF